MPSQTVTTMEPKDPDAVLDYAIDWSDWLDGDTIATSQWVMPSGIVLDSDSKTTLIATAWVSGGTADNTYTLTNRITTAAGRTQDRSIKVPVCESSEVAAVPTDAEVLASIDAAIARNPDGITDYELADGRRVTRMPLDQLLRVRGQYAARIARANRGSMFAGARFGRPL